MEHWDKPNTGVMYMRVTEEQWADAFVKMGSVKFNTPASWVEFAEKDGEGRGDFYEGTIAFHSMFDNKRMKEFECKYCKKIIDEIDYRPIFRYPYKGRLLYKDKRSMQLPCFCMYVLRAKDFECPPGIGKQSITAVIPKSYFEDIKCEKPALIVIENFDVFLQRLYEKLEMLGVKKEKVLVQYVCINDFEEYGITGYREFTKEYPQELFVKSKRFEEQKELRVVINTTDRDILEIFKNAIYLGDMSDIIRVYKGNLNGLRVKVNVELYNT